ncbi:sigma-70 family RNA polymerase sigma factor [Pendulispora brunnea]|uniref:Sigma-70 family RNA polymerase sigma factor n=1 Tax=Pendulispora brunnea TaxID=2905690 RepID=A0ABZ2KGG3_9BACT
MPESPAPKAPTSPVKAAADSPEVHARVLEGISLVTTLARQMHQHLGASLSIDDLEAIGREGLLDSARTFDRERGIPFLRWASLRIRGAMIDGARSHGSLPRRVYRKLRALEAADRVQEVVAEELAATPPNDPEAADEKLGEALSGMALAMAAAFLSPQTHGLDEIIHPDTESPEEEFAHAELMNRVRDAISKRPENERTLLERHYFDGITFEQAAQEIGLSKSWASRLHARAIEAISRELKRTGIKD